MNYNMKNIDKPFPEFLSMLRTTYVNIIKYKSKYILLSKRERGRLRAKERQRWDLSFKLHPMH